MSLVSLSISTRSKLKPVISAADLFLDVVTMGRVVAAEFEDPIDSIGLVCAGSDIG